MTTQDAVFADGEGDRWFLRNRSAITDSNWIATDPVLRLIEIAGLAPQRALEIGASNGFRLHALRERYGCRVTGVEPSQNAIDNGAAHYPDVEFLRGVANDLPIKEDGAFDLVIVNFVLHWVDRSTLMRSVAEIDRMIADGGYLIIGDFYPPAPQRVPYHHLPQSSVATYKQSYPEIFIASVLYKQVEALTCDHATREIRADVAPEERTQVVLLRKSLEGHYAPAFRS